MQVTVKEKCIHITKWVTLAWSATCKAWDSKKGSECVGMNLSIDWSGDDLIQIQGFKNFQF
jgi:hypothetical protein